MDGAKTVTQLILDRQGKFRYQVLSMHVDKAQQVELESSFGSLTESQDMFNKCYSKWGLTDQNFYLVDWQSQKILSKHEVFQNEFTRFFTR